MGKPPPSRSRINQVTSTLRGYRRGEKTEEQLSIALDVITNYRAQFRVPLMKVNNGQRGFCRTLNIEYSSVTQRLKREDTIVEKLTARETTMSLASMEDVAGCRVVLRTLDDLRLLERHIRKRWASERVRVRDYIVDPQPSGYRAVHVIV